MVTKCSWSPIFNLVLSKIGLKSVFGPSISFGISFFIETSGVCAFILYASTSVKYTPPRIVGSRTGIFDLAITTPETGYYFSSIFSTYARFCASSNCTIISSFSNICDLFSNVPLIIFCLHRRYFYNLNLPVKICEKL